MQPTVLAVSLMTALCLGGSALAQPPASAPVPAPAAPAAKAAFGPDSTFKDMAANPKARAILDAEIPLIMQVYDMQMFPGEATLKQVSEDDSAQSQGGFTKDAYDKIIAEFAKL